MENLDFMRAVDFYGDSNDLIYDNENSILSIRIYQSFASPCQRQSIKPIDEASLKKVDKSKKLFSNNEDQDIIQFQVQSRQDSFWPNSSPSALIGVTEEEDNFQMRQDVQSQEGHQIRNSHPQSNITNPNSINPKLKRNGEPLINGCLTNNFVSFIWKALRKYLLKQCSLKETQKYAELMKKQSNLANISLLFAQKEAYPLFQRIFKNHCLLRHVMRSTINSVKKKLYVKHLRAIYHGFQNKYIDRLK